MANDHHQPLSSIFTLLLLVSFSACRPTDHATVENRTNLQTATPTTAPQAQPHLGEVGANTTSRIVTNEIGQKGISVNETNARSKTPLEAYGETDAALSQRVRVALSTGTTGTQGTFPSETLLTIQVTASNGVVRLTGVAASAAIRKDLENRAKAIDGVRGVENNLTIADQGVGAGPVTTHPKSGPP